MNNQFLLDVAHGNYPQYAAVHKFGKAPAGVQATLTDIWDRADATPTQQIWTAPTVARVHAIVSTSTDDDGSPVGVGARTVRVFGLTSWTSKETSEDVTLNGTGAVNTANSYVIIHRMRVLTSGATSVNVGTITATAATDATVTAAILPGQGTTQMAIYGFPAGVDLYVLKWYGSVNKASGAVGTIDFQLAYNPEPNVQPNHWNILSERGAQSTGSSDLDWHFSLPYRMNGPGIVKIRGIASAADIDGIGGFDAILHG